MIKKMNLVTLIVLGILGLILVISPVGLLNTIVRLIALALLAVAAVNGIGLYRAKAPGADNGARLLTTVGAAILGIWMLAKPRFFESLIPVVLGILMIATGVLCFQEAMEKKQGKLVLALYALAALLGLIIVFNPFATLKLTLTGAGIALLYISITGILEQTRGQRKQ